MTRSGCAQRGWTCATSLVAGWWGRRWTLEEVCKLLGHSSITVTERYSHAANELLRRAAKESDESRNGGSNPGPPLYESGALPLSYFGETDGNGPKLAKTKGGKPMNDLCFTNSQGVDVWEHLLKLPLAAGGRK